MRKISGNTIPENKFSFPFRMILSGSSGSGKTHFAGELLRRNDLFQEKVSNVVYYYPGYLSRAPVNWEDEFDMPVSYKEGLPTREELVQLPKNTCVVIDDSYDQAVKSSCIDHLFRVISGKHRLCVMIMTQNNFTKGKYGREIRNSCNFSALFRNCCDASINEKAAQMSGLRKAYLAASRHVENEMYPYVFLDQSQQGQLSNYRLYTDIFGRFMKVWSLSGMKGYIIGASDFEIFFDIYQREGSNIFEATRNVDKNKNKTAIEESEAKPPKRKRDIDEHETNEAWWNSSSDEEYANEQETSASEEPRTNDVGNHESRDDDIESGCTQEPESVTQSQKSKPQRETIVTTDETIDGESARRRNEGQQRYSRLSRRDRFSRSRRCTNSKRPRNALFQR